MSDSRPNGKFTVSTSNLRLNIEKKTSISNALAQLMFHKVKLKDLYLTVEDHLVSGSDSEVRHLYGVYQRQSTRLD